MMVANRGTAPGKQAEQINGKEVLEKLQELLQYGYGRLEVVVRDHEISTLHWQKSMVKGGRRSSS
jgi:hypothetical protein